MIRVRFAPSPTGYLHLGGARTALYNWLFARHNQGKFVLRIEDSDFKRSIEDSEEKLFSDLKWLNLDWDEGPDLGGDYGPYRQSQRIELYQKYARELEKKGLVYPCYCLPEELEQKKQAALKEGETHLYDGTCRELSPKQRAAREKEGRIPALRFKVPAKKFVFKDLVKGEVEFDSSLIGDFVLIKGNQTPSYNFAVVVDDYLMKISHVIRGDEHLINTPRQVLLYEALGWQPPLFAHLGMILSKDRQKLSKRHGTTNIGEFRELGYTPQGLVNYIALLGWCPPDEKEIISREEMIAAFSLERLSKSPAIFDMDKLNWMGGQYIKQYSKEELYHFLLPEFQKAGFKQGKEFLSELAELFRERIHYGQEIIKEASAILNPDFALSEEAKTVLSEESADKVLNLFLSKLKAVEQLTPELFNNLLSEIKQESGVGGKKLFMPIRAALTGELHGPELNKLAALLGKEEILSRIEKILK